MEPISDLRFNALAGYARAPRTFIDGTEVGWYSESAEKVLGVIVQDNDDRDYVCIVMGRDRVGRYRAVHLSDWYDTVGRARAAMIDTLTEWAAKDVAEYEQGDEPREAVDFFCPRHRNERLIPAFRKLAAEEGFSPARGITEAMMYYFQDPDGNFVEQFQSTAFDSRLWELYLFALLAELRYSIDRAHPAPDFLCNGLLGSFFIEAATANPTIRDGQNVETGRPKNAPELELYMTQYLPIKFAGPLTNKLSRRYWEKAHIAGRPIVLAIADFHYPMSMTWSQTALTTYLYGSEFKWKHDEDGRLVITPEPIAEHVWGDKKVPSGFFGLPDAEHISAVISSREATISKFNRMGLKAGFGSPRVRMVRAGTRYVQDPNRSAPEEFTAVVHDPDYHEDWVDGLEVYHNPNAKIPLDVDMLWGATHHHILPDGQIESLTRNGQSFGTMTFVSLEGGPSQGSIEGSE